MLLVIADTSTIRYLVQIGHIDLLQHLFSAVTIPLEVAHELSHPLAPSAVQAWIKSPPPWLSVLDASGTDEAALSKLDPGEWAAIAFGIRLKADLILIDERSGYDAALSKGFEVTGTLGILDVAARRERIVSRHALERLRRTNFRHASLFPSRCQSRLWACKTPPSAWRVTKRRYLIEHGLCSRGWIA